MSDIALLAAAVWRDPYARVPVRMLADAIHDQGVLTWIQSLRRAARQRRDARDALELARAARCTRPGAAHRREIFSAVSLYLLPQTSEIVRVYIVAGSRPPELVPDGTDSRMPMGGLLNARVGARWILREHATHARYARALRRARRGRRLG